MQGDTIFVDSKEHQMNIRYINALPVFIMYEVNIE